MCHLQKMATIANVDMQSSFTSEPPLKNVPLNRPKILYPPKAGICKSMGMHK